MKNNISKKTAFTLAETLLTLIIIGVITAMTLPGLRKYTQMQENISLLKKSFSTIANVTKIVETKHGEMKRWGKLSSKENKDKNKKQETPAGLKTVGKYYQEALNTAKDCTNGEEGCWTQTKDLTNSNYGSDSNIVESGIAFSTTDGMNWSLSGITDTSKFGVNNEEANECLLIWVDTNGNKKPNMLGYDVFAFISHPEKGVLPAGIDNDSSDCTKTGKGTDCSARVLKENKISY